MKITQQLALADDVREPLLIERAQERRREVWETELPAERRRQQLAGETGGYLLSRGLERRPARAERDVGGESAHTRFCLVKYRVVKILLRPADMPAECGDETAQRGGFILKLLRRRSVGRGLRGSFQRAPFQAMPHAEAAKFDDPRDVTL